MVVRFVVVGRYHGVVVADWWVAHWVAGCSGVAHWVAVGSHMGCSGLHLGRTWVAQWVAV